MLKSTDCIPFNDPIEFHKNLYLQTVLIDSAEVHRMKYAFFMKVRKQKCVIMAKMIDQAFDMR